jgi:hypothetical protein
MAFNEITQYLAQYKETIWLIVTWFAWSVTHIFNKVRKGEQLTFRQHIAHIFISWFVWYMTYLILEYMGINWPMQWMIIWIASYSWIQIIDALDMIKANTIYNFFIDFIKYKIWKK